MNRHRELIERVCRAVLDGGPVSQEDIAALISALCMAEERVAALAGLMSEARTDLAYLVGKIASLPIPADQHEDVPVFGLDGHYITHGDVRMARAALAALKGGAA